jgi:putative protease
MEVLAPAGSKDALKAAILGGADAVYLGGKRFGARRYAENFTDAELKGAVSLAHDHGVKLYVTVNTLVKQGELREALSFIDLLNGIEVDAVIVQDRGLMRLIKEEFPLSVHASTQMGIYTPEGVRWAEENGVDRAILARELHLSEIARLREHSRLELEVFAHGALCYSVSGQCLFSSMVGGRSGNRGMCAQPCRKLYQMGEERSYALCTADIFCAEQIPALMDLGIAAVKIEGRMRSPVYVYLAAKTYSNAVRRAENKEVPLITPREREMLETSFNRGFSEGYLCGDQVMQRDFPESRGLPLGQGTASGGVLALSSQLLANGDGVTLYKGQEKAGGFEVRDARRGAMALWIPFTLPDGDYTVYKTKDREFDAIEGAIAAQPFPAGDAARRNLPFDMHEVGRRGRRADISVYVSSLKALEKVVGHADRVYYEWGPRFDEARIMCVKEGTEFVAMLPRVSPLIPDCEEENIMVSSVGQAAKFRSRRLFGHYSLNLFNALTVPILYQSTASVELSRDDLSALLGHFPGRVEVMVFGRVELMVSRDPTIKEGTLIDEKGAHFPVYRDSTGYAHILNSADLLLLDYLQEMEDMGVDSFGLDLRRKSAEFAGLVAKAFADRDIGRKSAIKRRCGAITAGHYLRGVE